MNIKMKAALRMGAVFCIGLIGAGLFYITKTLVPEAVFFGTIIGTLVGIALYNVYRMFLALEEMKEQAKK